MLDIYSYSLSLIKDKIFVEYICGTHNFLDMIIKMWEKALSCFLFLLCLYFAFQGLKQDFGIHKKKKTLRRPKNIEKDITVSENPDTQLNNSKPSSNDEVPSYAQATKSNDKLPSYAQVTKN